MRSIAQRLLILLAVGLLCLPLCALAGDEARDITQECHFRAGTHFRRIQTLYDDDYETYWESVTSANWLEITAPEQTGIAALEIKWYDKTIPCLIQVEENGEWVAGDCRGGVYLSDYIQLPEPAGHIRILQDEAQQRGVMQMAEIRLYSEGERNSRVQVWQPPVEKADLMLIAAHPDDEVLWFGGLMPTYAGEYGKSVQLCMMTPTMPYRRLELLDSLWTCGMVHYPVWGGFPDAYSLTLKRAYMSWKKEKALGVITGWYRRFKPDVVVTHDFHGEYGHGAHRLCADCCVKALDAAADLSLYPESAKDYGLWNVPKLYIHLYEENPIRMNWRIPLSAFGGKCGEEIAQEAFQCHYSQKKLQYRPQDSGEYDNAAFGLYRSLVGPDETDNDMFQHLPADPEWQVSD